MQGGAGVAVKGIEVAAVINPIGPLTSATIVYTQWNSRVICSLVGAAVTELLRNGVNEKDIQLLQVRPASHPLAFFLFAKRTTSLLLPVSYSALSAALGSQPLYFSCGFNGVFLTHPSPTPLISLSRFLGALSFLMQLRAYNAPTILETHTLYSALVASLKATQCTLSTLVRRWRRGSCSSTYVKKS
jgi:hypothetical protein